MNEKVIIISELLVFYLAKIDLLGVERLNSINDFISSFLKSMHSNISIYKVFVSREEEMGSENLGKAGPVLTLGLASSVILTIWILDNYFENPSGLKAILIFLGLIMEL